MSVKASLGVELRIRISDKIVYDLVRFGVLMRWYEDFREVWYSVALPS